MIVKYILAVAALLASLSMTRLAFRGLDIRQTQFQIQYVYHVQSLYDIPYLPNLPK